MEATAAYLSTENVGHILQALTQALGRPYDLAQLSSYMNKTVQQYPNINSLAPQQYLSQLNNFTIQSILSPSNVNNSGMVGGNNNGGNQNNGNMGNNMGNMVPVGNMGNNMGPVGNMGNMGNMAPVGNMGNMGVPNNGPMGHGEETQLSPDGQSLARMAEQLRRERNYSGGGGIPPLAGNPMMNTPAQGMFQSSRDVNMTDQMMYKLEQERRFAAQFRPPGAMGISTPNGNLVLGNPNQGNPNQGNPNNNANQGNGNTNQGNNGNNGNNGANTVPYGNVQQWPSPAMISGERLLSLDLGTDISDYEEGGIMRLSFPALAGVYRLELLGASLRHNNALDRPSYLYVSLHVNGYPLTGNCLTGMLESHSHNSLRGPLSFFAKLLPQRVSHNGFIDYEPITGSTTVPGLGASAVFNPPIEVSSLTVGFHDQRGESLDLRPFTLKRIVRLDNNQGVQITTVGPHRCLEGETLLVSQHTENGPVATAVRVNTVFSSDSLCFGYQSSTVQQLHVYQKHLAGHLTFRLTAA